MTHSATGPDTPTPAHGVPPSPAKAPQEGARPTRHTRRHSGRTVIRRRGKPGVSPGTLSIDPSAPKPAIRLFLYGTEDVQERAVRHPRELKNLELADRVAWVDVQGLGDADALQALGEVFGLHPLALEDVVNVHQRPKAEEYGELLFVVIRMPHGGDVLNLEQISMFVGPRFVLTFQERPEDCFDSVRDRIRRGRERLRKGGPDYLAYTLIDSVVDHYFPLLETFGERLDVLEQRILAGRERGTIAAVLDLKRDLMHLRRVAWSMRDTLSVITRHEGPPIQHDNRVFFRDAYDHTVQVLDLVEGLREFSSSLTDMHLSMVSQRMNEVMKVLTIIATIFIPLSFLTGIYGMNFDTSVSSWNMPELEWTWGYPFALTIMAAVAAGMLFFFWRRGWIGRQSEEGGSGGDDRNPG